MADEQQPNLQAVIETCAEIVWRTYRDTMLEQGRRVSPERMDWETLPCQDKDLDRRVARAVLDEAARSLWAREILDRAKAEAELRQARADNETLRLLLQARTDLAGLMRDVPDANKDDAIEVRIMEAIDAALSVPHPGQPVLNRLERLETLAKAAKRLRRYISPYPREDFPEIEHTCSTPNAVCGGECVDAARMAEHNAAIRLFDNAVAVLAAPEEKPS